MRFGFYSTMTGCPWGGSEELWSLAALELLKRGHEVTVSYKDWPEKAERLREIERAGGTVCPRRRIVRSLEKRIARWSGRPKNYWLDRERPDFVLVTMGYHLDPVAITEACRLRGIPYAINLQAASTHHWVMPHMMDECRAAYQQAQRCFFVSRDNQQIVETNLGAELANVEIVDNPFQVGVAPNLPWPAVDSGWRLACVGRLSFPSKGQDLILRVLSSDKWRSRPITVSLFGQDDGSELPIRDLIDAWQLHDKVTLNGFCSNVEEIWSNHHGLLLPSRYEGAPLVVVEAMRCARPCILTKVGRNEELIAGGKTGFLVPAPTVELLDEALEKAWAERHRWRDMGRAAVDVVRSHWSDTPVKDFADHLEEVAGVSKRRPSRRAA